MARIVLWNGKRFVKKKPPRPKKPSPLKNAVLTDDPMDVDPAVLPQPPKEKGERDWNANLKSTLKSHGEMEGRGQGQAVKKAHARTTTQNSSPQGRAVSVPAPSISVTPTRKRKARIGGTALSPNPSQGSVLAKTVPVSAFSAVPITSSESRKNPEGAPTTPDPALLAPTSIPSSSSLPPITTIQNSAIILSSPPAPPNSTVITLPLISTLLQNGKPPSTTTLMNKPSTTPANVRYILTPASRATVCPTCKGVHTSTCGSNILRLEEIQQHLSILIVLSQAVIQVVAAVLEIVNVINAKEAAAAASASTISPSTNPCASTSPAQRPAPEQGVRQVQAPESTRDQQFAELATKLNSLMIEYNTWHVRARPLMLETAMREGNLEEGERLRGLIRESGLKVRKGETEVYLQGLRDKWVNGGRGGEVAFEGDGGLRGVGGIGALGEIVGDGVIEKGQGGWGLKT